MSLVATDSRRLVTDGGWGATRAARYNQDMGFAKATVRVAASDAAQLVGWQHPRRLWVSGPIYIVALIILWLAGRQSQVIGAVMWLLASVVLAASLVFVPVFFFRLVFINPTSVARKAKQRIRMVEKERDDLRTDRSESITRLQSISASIRSLPQRRNMDHGLVDAATIAGKLMTDAMGYGLFDADEFVELRQVIDASLKGEFTYQRASSLVGSIRPAPHWHAFGNAIQWHRTQQKKPHISFCKAKFLEGCEWISDCIDEVVNRQEPLGKDTVPG